MRTRVSESGHEWARAPARVRRANAALDRVLPRVQPLELPGVSLILRQIHFGPGLFPKGQRGARHRHDDLQIEYVLEGRIRFGCEGLARRLGPRQGVWILPRRLHDWHVLRDVVMAGTLIEVAGPSRERFVRHVGAGRGGALPVLRGARIERWLREGLEVLLARPLGWEGRLGNLLGLWLWQCAVDGLEIGTWPRSAARGPGRTESRGEAACARAMDFMKANFNRPIKLADVSVEVGLSPRHLTRLFRRHGGDSVARALTAIRLSEARKTLRQSPELLVKQVAYACGFASPAYFTYCYRKAFGGPPREA